MFRYQSQRVGCLSALGLSLALSPAARAHMVVEGAGEWVNGALHPWMSPAHGLVLIGLGLLLGQQVPFDLKTPLRVLLPVSALALGSASMGWLARPYLPVLVGIALCIGILVGLERRLPRLGCGILCAAVALGIGLDSRLEGVSGAALVRAQLGTWFSVNAAVIYLAICASNGADKQWARTGIRVIGSWIVAISLMVLAFSLRK